MDEDSEVGSSYDAPPMPQQQQQLPPLRQPGEMAGMGAGMGAGMMYAQDPMGVHTHIAKYQMDRKFTL